ncbi:gamma-glutamyl-gamma-aminobutyrate hydrolase family protein [Marinobacterium lutimaris]|uniref:Putative glutamine amidotransferase n=1 Tax=Marinobacterium lutimaris TaxID=568106 RepID=A0A1H5YZM5_9GAMM|nr:gamma-glutamyl-gamma-aminobutyrate hydrolase family protein [Marinobacterium lutimaris]SEG29481.1 putative glutamine amidotransferase [Marinobacterium lutimaris]
MAARPRVGVTGNGRRWAPSWWCSALALRLAGATPERISVRHPPSGKALDGLVIGGGNDIAPEHYQGDIDAKVKLDPARDELEIQWINHAIDARIPLLGICRGAQLINVVLGGNLHQDIRPLRKHTYNRPGLLPTKQVKVAQDSVLAQLCGKLQLRVNSLHHQAIRDTGEGLEVVGRDLDQITQAVEHINGQPIIGVQWHPEYLFYLPSQFALFRWLVSRMR